MSVSKRERVVIDPAVQWAMARRFCYHWLAFFAVLIGTNTVLRTFFSLTELGFAGAWREALGDQLPQIAIMVIVLPLFLYDTLKLSNRFAGPMYRVRKSLASLADGETLPQIKFRYGDFWQEMATHLNGVRDRVSNLELRNSQLAQENRRLKRELESANQSVSAE